MRQTVFISFSSTFFQKLSYPPYRQLFCSQSQRTEHHLHPKRLVGRNSSPGARFQLCPPWRGIPYRADHPGHTGEHELSLGEGTEQKHSPSACRVAGLFGVHLWMSNGESKMKICLALTRSVVKYLGHHWRNYTWLYFVINLPTILGEKNYLLFGNFGNSSQILSSPKLFLYNDCLFRCRTL